MNTNAPTKEQAIDLLRAWINQRPGLDFANYGERKSYFAEVRRITGQLHDARILLAAVETSGITASQIMEGTRAYSGRLQIKEKEGDAWGIEYCTGQYWPTEYRAAACAVLASALWDYHREDIPTETDNKGDVIRAKFRRMFGRSIADRWFN